MKGKKTFEISSILNWIKCVETFKRALEANC